ncbi:hypothetical protein KVJ43_002156 [Enterococcus faecalis]|uniref:hypothetical protein n=1 Tax=Enterococcus faecalis TaxID=1351 RepID=UPI0003303F98|nr:hypothetical protein [Enterococcus faecalis]EGO2593678.1 hypothetical protein [Enterococcus faecalis]EGO2690956.1 hypothetical protein [Enterococcus faecalis]EGO6095774.1 hypothetical protein [Enterococcus faecalis]EGO6558389.1 hypothetical protein [Enterococcus faecalis]EGO6564746.1 hypothetical protein [Enterococcus faecalis]
MMRKQEIEVVSLNIIKYYFLAIRELDFPGYDKPFKQIDVELFIKLADYMENLPGLEDRLIVHLEMLKDYLLSVENEKYSRTVQRMVRRMKEELEKVN